MTSRDGARVRRLPPERIPQIELMPVLALRNPMHGFVEADVTLARRRLRAHRERTGQRVSFTAFVIACLATAIDAHRDVHAFRRGHRLVVFDQVDVATLVEVDADGERVPLPYVVRDAAGKDVLAIHRELRAVQGDPDALVAGMRRRLRAAGWVPRPARWLLWRGLARSPRLWKRFGGTAVVTSVGMFGSGGAWGLGLVTYPVTLTVGGIATRPALRDGQWAPREQLCLTISLDHEAVDGGPAARFMTALREQLERADVLAGLAASGSQGAAATPGGAHDAAPAAPTP